MCLETYESPCCRISLNISPNQGEPNLLDRPACKDCGLRDECDHRVVGICNKYEENEEREK